MINKHGKEPHKVVVIHGGPGARGELSSMAKELSRHTGVLEPFQTKYSIDELVEELRLQIKKEAAPGPVTLIGHSWGAWLSILFYLKYPKMVKDIVLVGSAPFTDEYIEHIDKRRRSKLGKEQEILFNNALDILEGKMKGDQNLAMQALGYLIYRADNYFPLKEAGDEVFFDNKMRSAIWDEASKLRKSGKLYKDLKKIKCPLHVIHGEHDPHPVEGVTEPLKKQKVKVNTHLLPRCGHWPFKEKYAKEAFYEILKNIIKNEKALV